MARTILIENTTVSTGTWVGQTLATTETFDIPQTRIFNWANDATVIADVASGDLKVIKSTGPTVYYTAAEGQRVLDGLSPGLAASGNDGEYLCTNVTSDLVWGAGSISIEDEGVPVSANNCVVMNFMGPPITVTDGGSGVVNVTVADSIFGSEFEEASSDTESSTTSSTFQTKLSHSTASLTNGNKYRIGYSFECKNSDTVGEVYVDIEVDGVDVGETIMEPSDPVNYMMQSGFYHCDTLSGSVTLAVKFKRVTAGTAYIKKARLEIWRVS